MGWLHSVAVKQNITPQWIPPYKRCSFFSTAANKCWQSGGEEEDGSVYTEPGRQILILSYLALLIHLLFLNNSHLRIIWAPCISPDSAEGTDGESQLHRPRTCQCGFSWPLSIPLSSALWRELVIEPAGSCFRDPWGLGVHRGCLPEHHCHSSSPTPAPFAPVWLQRRVLNRGRRPETCPDTYVCGAFALTTVSKVFGRSLQRVLLSCPVVLILRGTLDTDITRGARRMFIWDMFLLICLLNNLSSSRNIC